ncbi:MAG: hypothetical protein FDZ75_05225 [Actinobacteria bacterium]|nr:MAG: hypothetical protein FDZ75_05225 [Actinomycetota bacterium]
MYFGYQFLLGPDSLLRGQPLVTLAEYQQVREGMTYHQVCAAVGSSGTENGRQAAISGAVPEMVGYVWQNPDGSNMICMFAGDSLYSKAQAALR